MSKLAALYPGDYKASIFYALSLSILAGPADKTYSKQLKAGAILEALFRKEPRHPGIIHYIIHTYDFPQLAPHVLEATRAYARFATRPAHAFSYLYTPWIVGRIE